MNLIEIVKGMANASEAINDNFKFLETKNKTVEVPGDVVLEDWLTDNLDVGWSGMFYPRYYVQGLPNNTEAWRFGSGLFLRPQEDRATIIIFSTTGSIASKTYYDGEWSDYRMFL